MSGANSSDRAALLARIRAALRSKVGTAGDDATMDADTLNISGATGFGEVPQSAFDALAARWDALAGNGQPIDDLFDGVPPDAANQAAIVMLNGLSQGPLAIAQNLAQVLQMSQSRAETIARNELVSSYRDAQMANYRANSDVVGQWMWSAAIASACIMCVEMDGTIHSMDEDLLDHVCGRCEPLPITKSWDDIMAPYGLSAADIPETRITESYGNGHDWFMSQDAATQRDILGPAKFEAWSRGDISLNDLVGVRDDGAWGSALYEKSLKELGLDAQDYLPRAPQTGLGRRGKQAIEEARARQAAMAARGGEGLGPQGIQAIKGAERTATELDMVRIDMGNGMFTYVLREDAGQFDAAADLTSARRGEGWQNIEDVLAGLRGEATGAAEAGTAVALSETDKNAIIDSMTALKTNLVSDERGNIFEATHNGHEYVIKESYPTNVAVAEAANDLAARFGMADHFVGATSIARDGKIYEIMPKLTGTRVDLGTREALMAPDLMSQEERVKLGLFDYLLGHADASDYNSFITLDHKFVQVDIDQLFADYRTTPDVFNAALGVTGFTGNGDAAVSAMSIPDDVLNWLRNDVLPQRDAILSTIDGALGTYGKYAANDIYGQSGGDAASIIRLDALQQLVNMPHPTLGDLDALVRSPETDARFQQLAKEIHTRLEAGQPIDDLLHGTAATTEAAAEPTVSFATDVVQTRLLERLDNPGDEQFARLMGAQPGDRVEVDRVGQVFVRSDDYTAQRWVSSPDEDGSVGMLIQQYSSPDGTPLPVDERFAAMLRTQVEAVQETGSPLSYLRIKARPATSDYEDLLTVGFDAPVNINVLTEAQGGGLPPLLPGEFAEKFPGVTTLRELVADPEGAAWWHANGLNPDLNFDLTPGSADIKTLNDYLAAHDMPLVGEAVTEGATEVAAVATADAEEVPQVTEQQLQDAIDNGALQQFGESYNETSRATIDGQDYFVKQLRSGAEAPNNFDPDITAQDQVRGEILSDKMMEAAGLGEYRMPGLQSLELDDKQYLVQPWQDGMTSLAEKANPSEYLASLPAEDVQRLRIFHYAIGDMDRNIGNYTELADGRFVAIDHGFAFSAWHGLMPDSTIEDWDVAVSSSAVQDILDHQQDMMALAGELSDARQDAMQRRFAVLQRFLDDGGGDYNALALASLKPPNP